MGAGNPPGVVTNGDKVVEIMSRNLDHDYAAQQICDALGVDPEGEWQEGGD